MKNGLLCYLAIAISVFIVGCDPVFDVDYEVNNISGESLSIVVDYAGFKSDTNTISDHTRLVFLNESTICCTTRDYLDRLEILPFEISIVNSNGELYNKNTADLTNWQKFYPEKKSGAVGKVQLTVRSEDFN